MKTNVKNLFSLLLLFSASILWAQKTVSGTVTDPEGIPIPDATVSVVGSGEQTLTDFDGNYSIQANEGDVIEVDALGFSLMNQTVGSSNSLNFSIAEGGQLDEVVVTALNISREKKALGYATQRIDGDELNAAQPTNAISSLSGNVSGLQVSNPSGNMGGSTRIVLRGIGSVTQNNKPLIVVDGIPMDNSNYNGNETARGGGGRDYGDALFDLNPNDIASYDVLKGGPASALYGSRGQNGVILITTKKGKKGTQNIEINSGISFENVAFLPDLQTSYGGGFGDFGTATINGEEYNVVGYGIDESWGPRYDASLMALHWDAFDPEFSADYLRLRPWVAPENDVEDFFKTGVSYNNNVSFTKGFDNSNFRISLGGLKTYGTVPNTELKRTNVSLGGEVKLNEKISAKGSINYVLTEGFNRPEVGYSDNSIFQKFFQWGQRQLDYKRLREYKTSSGQQRTWNRTSWDDGTPVYSDNPYWTIYENISKDKRHRYYGNLGFNFELAKNLILSTNLYGDTYSLYINDRGAVGSAATSYYKEIKRNFSEYNYEAILRYSKEFTNFSLNAMAGANRRNNKYDAISGETQGGLAIPNLYDLNNSKELALVNDYREEKRVNSLYGSLSLGYKGMLYLDVTGRNDWSSTLPSDNNSYFYPSFTGSFVFSELISSSWLTFGKLRGGWSRVGNDTGPYQLQTSFTVLPPFNGAPRYSNPTTFNNPDLKPEMKSTSEFGIELGLFKRRVNFDFTYYSEETEDLITTLQVEDALGIGNRWINAGRLENKGIETTLNVKIFDKKDFSWDVTWNFAKNDNELVELYEDAKSLSLVNAPFKVKLWAVVGQRYGQIIGSDFVYDDAGNRVVDASGRYIVNPNQNLGSVIPDFNTGVRNSLRYKNFNFGFLIDIQKGGNFYALSHTWGMYSGMLQETVDNNIREEGILLNAVQGDVVFNDDGSYTVSNTTPNETVISAVRWGADHYSRVDAQNVFDASYVKLRELSLSYSLPKSLISNFMKDITFSVFARNVATWGLDNPDFDPEMATTSSGNIQGLEGGSMVPTRTIGFNVKLNF